MEARQTESQTGRQLRFACLPFRQVPDQWQSEHFSLESLYQQHQPKDHTSEKNDHGDQEEQ
jgi:hypothetical protein